MSAVPITLTFWFPLPPVESTNASYAGHWATRKRRKDEYLEQLDLRQMTKQHIPAPPHRPFPRATLTACYHLRSKQQFMDRDGRTSRLKRVLDWLVTRGYIVDDDDEHLDYTIPSQQVRTSDTPPLCSLYIMLTQSPLLQPEET